MSSGKIDFSASRRSKTAVRSLPFPPHLPPESAHPCDGCSDHPPAPLLDQYPGALIEGVPGGEHIIDQHNFAPRGVEVQAGGEGPAQIAQPLLPSHARLRSSSGHAPQPLRLDRKAGHRPHRPGQQFGLIITPFAPPGWMQGRAFLGRYEAPPHEYLHGFRGRMGARYDMVRCVRDQRYVYVRNYMPQLPQGREALKSYAGAPPSEREWKRLFDAGKLTPVQARYWQPRPPEQLYDLQSDPYEITNLADSPEHQAILARLRKVQQEQITAVYDVGFLPEAEMHHRSQGTTPYDLARDAQRYPLARIVAMAELASRGGAEALAQFRTGLADADPAVRYWAALGVLIGGQPAVAAARDDLRRALADESPNVRIVAAQALGQCGRPEDCAAAAGVLGDLASYNAHGIYVSQTAMNAIELLGDKARPALDGVRAIPAKVRSEDARVGQTYLWMKKELAF